jgi:HlyD family type I secretion membrane fusion protein
MKFDLEPIRPGYVTPTFGGEDTPMAPELRRRLRRPMIMGGAVIGVFVIGLGLWASVSQVASGITARAEVVADTQRKTVRHRDPGVVKQILVKEGQFVRSGQPLILFNDVETRAAVDVLQSQYDTLIAQNARFAAESTGQPLLKIPAELTQRAADPRVAALIHDQEFLFATRRELFQSQSAVLGQRMEQQQTQVDGLQAQVDSIAEQQRLTNEELDGYKKLNEQGYAPKTLILRYERSLADLAGRKGQLLAEIARLKQQMGETRLQLASLRDERESQAAEGVRDSQARLADVIPRLTTARQNLADTVVRSPVDGYVFGLTQYTPGGVVGGGELLMNVVPAGTPLTITAMIKPTDVDEVHVGMPARVKLTGLNQRFTSPLEATVTVVSADAITNDRTGDQYYRVDLRIAPSELKKLKKGVQLTPGMPASALIKTGERSVMGFIVSPFTAVFEDAFREE